MRRRTVLVFAAVFALFATGVGWLFEDFREHLIDKLIGIFAGWVGMSEAELAAAVVARIAPIALAVVGAAGIFWAGRLHASDSHSLIISSPNNEAAPIVYKVRKWYSCWEAARKYAPRKSMRFFKEREAAFTKTHKTYLSARSAFAKFQRPTAHRRGGGGPLTGLMPSPPPTAEDTAREVAKATFEEAAANQDRARESRDNAANWLADDMRGKLISGELVARGFTSLAVGRDAQPILPAQWNLLLLNLDESEAQAGNSLHFLGVEIGRRKRFLWF